MKKVPRRLAGAVMLLLAGAVVWYGWSCQGKGSPKQSSGVAQGSRCDAPAVHRSPDAPVPAGHARVQGSPGRGTDVPPPEKHLPAWVDRALALYDAYHPREGTAGPETAVAVTRGPAYSVKSTGPVDVSPRIRPASPPVVSSPPAGVVRSPAASGMVSGGGQSRTAGGGVLPTAGSSGGSTDAASGGGGSSGENSTSGTGGNGTDGGSDSGGETAPVSVTRTVTSTSAGARVTLNITVGGTLTGLIVTENVPAGYTVVSSSPHYTKKSGNAYKWLFYGQSVPSQSISYDLSGSGKAQISGSFSSGKGGGTISGDTQIGG